MKKKFKNKNGKRAFTILEMLIILGILAIVALVVKMSTESAITNAQDVRRVTDIRAITMALEQNKGTLGTEYVSSVSMPTYIGTILLSVPINNLVNNGNYSWFDNTSDSSVFCTWATLSDEDALSQKKYYVGNQFGAGYFESEPESLYNCGYYIDEEEGNPWHDPGDTPEEDPEIPDPNDKVYICHLNKRGNGKTLQLPQPAVQSHLNHGDYLGPCD